MNSFHKLAGRLIEHYRKEKQQQYGQMFNMKNFCVENGKNICSFPTYKKLANGEFVNNDGFYYRLCMKLDIKYETLDSNNESFIEDFFTHFNEVCANNSTQNKIHFCDYYEPFFKIQKDFLVFRELQACIDLLKGINNIAQETYLNALESVVDHPNFVSSLKSLRN